MVKQINKEQIKEIVIEYIKMGNKALGELDSLKTDEYYVNEMVFMREDVICISNESNCQVYEWDLENDCELSDQLCGFIKERLAKKGLVVKYNMGAFEIYGDEQ